MSKVKDRQILTNRPITSVLRGMAVGEMQIFPLIQLHSIKTIARNFVIGNELAKFKITQNLSELTVTVKRVKNK
jgi:hypothetical protein